MTENTKKKKPEKLQVHYYDRKTTVTGCNQSHNKWDGVNKDQKTKTTRFVEEVTCQDCLDLMVAQKFIHIEDEYERGELHKKLVRRQVSTTMRKLEEAFTMGSTVLEACAHAEISRTTYYNWTKDDPSLIDRFERLAMKPTLKSRAAAYNSLDDPKYAFEYLKRQSRTRAEFAERVEQSGPDGQSLPQPLININFNDHDDKTTGEKTESSGQGMGTTQAADGE